jgi:nitrous oxidase accessory protein
MFFLFLSAARVGGQESRREITVAADNLAAAIARASNGDIINVSGGAYYGSLEIDKRLTINGIDWPVIDGQGSGTVLKLTAPGTIVRDFVIRNSGSSLDQENAGIAVEAADITIENNRLEETLFGIYLRDANGSIVRNNHVTSKELDVPRRGDPIRVWYSTDVLIEGNVVVKGRDVVLWYSERLTVRGNEVSDGRYGLHFMYCDDALIEQNRLLNNSVGTFLMYSRRMTMQHNTIANNRGPSGYGVGLKDMDDAVVKENLFLNNRIGAHVDGSPREVDSIGRFEGNIFAYNDIGVNMLPAVRHNEFLGNSFVDNEEQVAVAGGGRLRENDWTVGNRGNYWSDYAGYDANEDGQGDIEYKSERLFENLMSQEPNLRLFLYSPAVNAIDLSARAFPVVKPQPKLTDTMPLMAPIIPQDAPLLPQPAAADWLLPALVAIVLALALAGLPRLGRHRFRSLTILEKTQ